MRRSSIRIRANPQGAEWSFVHVVPAGLGQPRTVTEPESWVFASRDQQSRPMLLNRSAVAPAVPSFHSFGSPGFVLGLIRAPLKSGSPRDSRAAYPAAGRADQDIRRYCRGQQRTLALSPRPYPQAPATAPARCRAFFAEARAMCLPRHRAI